MSALGTPAIAAITAGQRINFVMIAVLMGMGAATTAIVSNSWGAQNKNEAVAYTRLSLKIGLSLCLLLSINAIALAKPLAHFFQLEDISYELAVDYIRWLSLFGPAQGVIMIMSTACRAIGDARTPLLIGIFTNLISIIAAYVLAYGLWGLPVMGISGAAIGWGLAFTLSALFYLWLWFSNKLSLPFSYQGKAPAISITRFLNLSMPATIEQLLIQVAMLLFFGFIASYGTEAFAAFGVGMNLFSVAVVIVLGFSVASSALVGLSLGAKNGQAAKKAAREALLLSMTTMTIAAIISSIFATELANFMVDDPIVAQITEKLLLVVALVLPLLAIDFVLAGALRGSGNTRFPLVVSIVTIFGVRLPLAGLFSSLGLSIGWVFSVFIIDQAFKAILLGYRYKKREQEWLMIR